MHLDEREQTLASSNKKSLTNKEIEVAILSSLTIDDCVVIERQIEKFNQELVAYVVPSGIFAREQLLSHLETIVPSECIPTAIVPVSTLPLTASGQIDATALSHLEIKDPDLVEQWSEQIQSVPEVKQVAVVIQEQLPQKQSLRLSDLLPNWNAVPNEENNTSFSKNITQNLSSNKLAISHGGELERQKSDPKLLAQALQKTAREFPEKTLIYIQSDGSEIIQSYKDLLLDAQKILAGLRKLGLKPLDKVIFQIDISQDFIPAFWGCILGGFIPVPVSIAPAYEQVNSAVNKLHNAWQMLKQPIVLTSSRLAPSLRELPALLKKENFQVETVDKLRQNQPDSNIHQSDQDDLALLLLTSGSTGFPKAVMLTHRNLLSMTGGLAQMKNFSSEDIVLNWMPLEHVGAIVSLGLMAVDLGCQQIHASTEYILQNPIRWLELIQRYQATISWAPNFAFSLLNERKSEINQRSWNLSCMGFVINAGEQIVPKTVRSFLKLLQPHGLPSNAIHPAFGMSETSSGITYSDGFSLETSSDEMSFVELGPPIPGASIRITDENNQIVSEGVIGRFQVKGLSVTRGYYENPERNREAFTEDGWFNTGDLGYLQSGRIVLTGRDKDDIIINGINYYSHEIESVVEEVEGVEISYTAASAVQSSNNADQLAIFFSPAKSDVTLVKELLKKIRGAVVKNIGVNPNYIIPVKKALIPKTAIGKIQRSQLSRMLKAGEFNSTIQEFGINWDDHNLLPDWFYRRIWRQKVALRLKAKLNGGFLIFLDQLGLGEHLGAELQKQGQQWVGIETGVDFTQLSDHRYQIAPNNPEHYQLLLSSLKANNFQIAQIIHLWTYESGIREISSLESLDSAQTQGVYSLLSLIKSLAIQKSTHAVELLVVSNYTQFTSTSEEIAYEKSPLLGLVKVISQEIPGLTSRHVDLSLDEPSVNAKLVLQEMQALSGESEVAYRQGERWIPRLEKVDFRASQQPDFAFAQGGMYLLTGGLGGVGVEIAKYLLKHYKARLLLVGRTNLPERSEWQTYVEKSSPLSQKIATYLELEEMSGEIIYEAVDVCDLPRLKAVVEQAQSRWGCRLDGVLHLAGTYQVRSLSEENPESWSAALRAKVGGAWVLNQLLLDHPQAVSIHFSSVSSFLGGATVGAFVAGNQFLESFAHYQRSECGLKSYCFSWSLWEGIGISLDDQRNKLATTKGYCAITARLGLSSMLIGLHHNQVQMFIGLDGSNRHIRGQGEETYPLTKLTAYYTTSSNSSVEERLSELVVRDRFGTLSSCNFVQLQQMPLTQTGIIDLRQLIRGELHQQANDQAQPGTDIERQVAQIWQQVLGLESVSIHDNFFELGGHSLLLIQAQSKLQEFFGSSVSIVDMFKYPSISTLAKYLSQGETESPAVVQGQKRAKVRSSRHAANQSDIAVIGMSCRFPGANNIDEFWQNLCNGVESISFFTDEEIIATGVDPALVKNPHYVKAKPILSDVESFDADFFGYSTFEAELMDPQQRLLLECAWESLEDAGYNPLSYDGAIGIYAGAVMNTYLLNNIYPQRHQLDVNDNLQVATMDSMGGFQMMVANDKDYLTTRVSYKLNLTGPSVNVQTACSTSLVAIHMACASLASGESDMVLAGGVSVHVPQKVGHLYQEGMIVTPDGHCRAFDARAQGTIFGSGAGIVVLKRLEDAKSDGDHIYAVVKGSAVNNDGGTKVGYMAPNGDGQAAVVTQAMAMAAVDADTIGYVEAHGTGTPLGDPIEIGGLTQAFRSSTQSKNFCAIGSVKTNVGHLQIASGVVGFMKTVLSLYHKKIPPSLHFEQPNPQLDLPNTPFYVNTTLKDWQTQGNPRRAGVNSLGIGGTNAHVILEEAPEIALLNNEFERPYHILALSAKNQQAMADLQQRYLQFLTSHQSGSIADICYTANTGREHFNHRLAVVADSREQLVAQLADSTIRKSAEFNQKTPKIAFLFTGQGSQYINMGRQLYDSQPVFRQTLEQCDEILRPLLEHSLLEVLYPTQAQSSVSSLLEQTAYTQPALFALEYALYQLWKSWGIEPDVVMGHSVGEYVAATVAGVFSLEDGLLLIAQRGKLMQQLPEGGEMVSLMASEAEVREVIASFRNTATLVQPTVDIAAINSSESVVISGASEEIAAICEKLKLQGVKTKRLQVSHAFHSPLMTPMLADFATVANRVTYNQPRITIVSNVTGQLANENMTTAEYWVNHVRQTVQFSSSMQTLQDYDIFLEIGPKPTLLSMGQECLPDSESLWLPSLRPGVPEWEQLLSSLSKLYLVGVQVDWSGMNRDYPRRKVALPKYPFQRQRYWIENPTPVLQTQKSTKQLQQINSTMNGKDMVVNGKESNIQVDVALREGRREEIIGALQALIGSLLHVTPTDVNIHAPFLEMGADSIVMVDAVQRINNIYGLKITLRQLFEELATPDALAIYIDQQLPAISPKASPAPEVPPEPTPVMAIPTFAQPQISTTHQPKQVEATVSATALERIMAQQLQYQLQLMSKQLEVLQDKSIVQPPEVVVENGRSAIAHTHPQPVLPAHQNPTSQKSQTVHPVKPIALTQVSSPWGPKKPPTGGLTPQQQQHLDALIERYTQRTKTSKKLVESARPVLADSRASVGFRLTIKEMLYPIVAEQSQGSRIWDVDGNEYIDMTMGQGVSFFGHKPPFIMEALEAQLKQGIHLNPRSPLVGEVAKLFTELTGMERVCFCNSGTEAVMAAIRVARAVTSRTKIVLFEGSYHGHADGTLVRHQIIDNERRSFPLSVGVPAGVVDDVIVLEYGSSQSLEFLQIHAHELAAVLVEPVQSGQPMLQPRDFLHSLRQITAQAGTALIFDEMITGFRSHPGGAQALYGVRADIATYGKLIAGGMPIGALAGKSQYLDSIDGGMWNYGDSSYPQTERTFFGGTFCQHPLAMVAARAVLKHLKEQGPTLQQQLNDRTSKLAATLNTYFLENEVPIQIEHFSSFFRFALTGHLDLLFYHMVEKGIYVWEWRKHFLSTAHTEADISQFIQAIKDSVEELRLGGFLPAKKLWVSSQITHSRGHNTTTTQVDLAEKNTTKGFWERHRSAPSNLEFKASSNSQKPVQFSLYYFGSYAAEFSTNKYNLLFEGARFGDRHGFTAIWIPERHFHAFGGFSPNPSVIAAALARETQQIQLRSGSVVLPLHHPIRVAEEWAVVDNLSQGRVGISFASGWHAHDFVLAPQSFGKHRELMFTEIETVQKLWQGEFIEALDGAGKKIRIKTYPMPMQSKLPIWITIVNNPDTYIRAGEIGAGILTNLMGQTVEDLAQNIALYRESLAKHGYPEEVGCVTVLLHTFVGNDLEQTREQARKPFGDYMKSSIGLMQNMFKSQGLQVDFDKLTEEDRDFIISSAYKRYVQTSALIGTPASCRQVIDNLRAVGVDEIACFIDFGVDENAVLENLPHLNTLKEFYQQSGENHVSSGNAYAIPLTEAQKQLWIIAQLGEDRSVTYNESVTLQLRGSLNLEAMGKAIQKVVDRHEALRTKISLKGDVQEIISSIKIDCPVLDFSCVEEDAKGYLSRRNAQVAEWFGQQSSKIFDLTNGPLLRLHILKLEPELYLLLLSAHHIVVDGWSIGVILRELGALYSAECQGIICQLNPPKQFREFIEWQNKHCQTQKVKADESYWLEKLTAPPVLDLPTDRIRPPIQTYNGSRETIKFDSQVTNNLKLFSRQQGCTLLMTLLSVFMTLIHRLTGQDDIIIGLPTSGRSLLGSEGIVGYCTHFLPIRSELSGNPTFVEYLKQIRGILLDAYEHQDYPFAQLLNQLNIPRDNSRSPLISVSFNVEPPIPLPEFFQLETSLFPQAINFKDRDLHLNVIEIAGELLVECDYNTDLFDAETNRRWLSHFQTLLQAVVTEPKQHLRELPLLTVDQRHQLLVEWNDTETNYPCDQAIHQLFEAQVERTPDAKAVVFGEQHLSYAQLNAKANQLAHYLQTLGVGPEVLVGICVERSIEMVVGLLGILKAGGAYVPLDPEYPTERLIFMLEDSGASVLLTQQRLVDRLPEHGAQLVCLDADWQEISQSPHGNFITGVQASNLAYIIYTSGSTGKPKAVAIEHHSPVALVSWAQSVFTPNELTGVLASTSICFDLSVFELFVTLSLGGKIILAENAIHLSTITTANQVTLINTVPSAIAELIRENNLLPQVCTVNLAGEPLQNQLVQQIYQHSKVERVFNLYGPSEDTTYSTFSLIEKGTSSKTTIGQPIANTQIYILDQYLQPVPMGVPGELHIGGAGLARGYLNRQELTRSKFIPNPFSTQPHSRLYKTGDKARYLPNGNIEYLGRIDNQVKIRGFRIELGEIEAALSQNSYVQASVVIAREDNPGNKRLVAYIVPQPQQTPTVSELRQFLKSKLPDYMIPSAIVIIESLPLTPNGKIDKRALPEPEARAGIEVAIVLPRSPVEEKLALIWAQVLRVELIGIHDNFFELGGDSILGIQIMSKAKEVGLELTVKQLFANQTIASLATVVGTTKALSIEQGLVTGTLPLTPIQQWFFEQNSPQLHHFNQSFLLTVPFDIKSEILEQVWQELLLHHDALRLRFTQTDGTWQQIHAAPTESMTISRFDLSTVPESELTKTIETTANQLQASLNLSENLVAVGFFWLGIEKRGRLLIVIHHLVVDGVSWRILLEDLQSGYEQLTQGKAIQLQRKTTSFKDWAFPLQEYAQSEVLKSELAYWLSASRAGVASIPRDYATGVNTVASASAVSVSLTEAETHSLLQDVPKAYKTQINDVLLTALVLVLISWTNSKSVLFNLEGHGREDIVEGVDLSRTVGWFTTIFPVVLTLEAKDKYNIGNALKSVKEQLRAIPNKGIGYGLLRYLNEDPQISAQLQTIPHAEISFNYLGQFDQVLNTSSLMQLASESSGQSQSLLAERPSLLEINAIITNERLHIDWIYSSNIHQHKTIEKMALEFVETLRSLITHCLSPSNAGYTPTDFPLVTFNQQELDQILANL